jgi:hypothetical protein
MKSMSDTLKRNGMVGVAVFAVVLPGCALLQNEDEGDKAPNIGEYRVSVSPRTVVLEPIAGQTVSVDITTIKAVCAATPPTDCAGHDPQWEPKTNSELTKNLKGSVAQPSLAETTGKVAITKFDPYGPASLGVIKWYAVEFLPARIPDKLRLAGSGRVDVESRAPGQRSEKPPDKPGLSVLPARVRIESDTPASRQILISYRGPETQLLPAVITGPDAAKFSVGGPPLPMKLGNRDVVTFVVTFDGSDGPTYKATLTTATSNDVGVAIPLSGSDG